MKIINFKSDLLKHSKDKISYVICDLFSYAKSNDDYYHLGIKFKRLCLTFRRNAKILNEAHIEYAPDLHNIWRFIYITLRNS